MANKYDIWIQVDFEDGSVKMVGPFEDEAKAAKVENFMYESGEMPPESWTTIVEVPKGEKPDPNGVI